MAAKRLIDFLDGQKVHYVNIIHPRTYTAEETASSAHIPSQDMAKPVMFWVDGRLTMVVLPANEQVSYEELRESLGAISVELANETEFCDFFPDCEQGAMPPFGNLYGIPVYESQRLTRDKVLAFNAGSHTELIRMSHEDWQKLVHPTVVTLSV